MKSSSDWAGFVSMRPTELERAVAPSLSARYGAVVFIYAVTIFTSAALLFFVQPMYAKMVLPYLGGAPAIWTTAMLFFQSALLAGYAYAHFLSRHLSMRGQMWVHGAAWMVGLLFLPIAVPETWTFDPHRSPELQTLKAFALGVGAPFIFIAANAPLLQKWYARTGAPSGDDPYHLYAASNAGSLLALLLFPLVAEPLFGASAISQIWATGYLALGIGLAASAAYAWRGSANFTIRVVQSVDDSERTRISTKQWLGWAGLAFVPSSMMLGITSIISTDLGAFPLVWVIPLALYLLSFVLAFYRRLHPPQAIVDMIFIVSIAAVASLLALDILSGLGLISFALLFLAFFSTALVFHIRLYKVRPPETWLTPFYFAMASGGALGGLFNSLVAPAIFASNLEVYIVFGLAGLGLAGSYRPLRDLFTATVALVGLSTVFAAGMFVGLLQSGGRSYLIAVLGVLILMLFAARRQPLRFSFVIVGLLVIGGAVFGDRGIVFRDRSFFGIYSVQDEPKSGLRTLLHGTTQHGRQFIDDLGKRPRILSYYHPGGAIGQVFRSGAVAQDARVAVVGLGVGALSCYAEPAQTWRFYEIDSLMDSIARDTSLFSYMEACARDATTVLGDARLTLARESGEAYDVLVIDAYSSDAIPVHLITVEALELYRSRLNSNGLLVMHISNRFYRLAPVLASAAERLGMRALEQAEAKTAATKALGEQPAHVVLMSSDASALDRFAQDTRWDELISDGRQPWTDDHASLLSVLR